MTNNTNLVAIDAGLFCEGMYVRSGIYYLYDNSFILLCKNMILTQAIIQKLSDISVSLNGIYIEEEFYSEVWNESLSFHSPEEIKHKMALQKAKNTYNSILSDTVSLLSEASAKNGNITSSSRKISESIVHQVYNTDESMLVDLVNQIQETDNYLYTHSAESEGITKRSTEPVIPMG